MAGAAGLEPATRGFGGRINLYTLPIPITSLKSLYIDIRTMAIIYVFGERYQKWDRILVVAGLGFRYVAVWVGMLLSTLHELIYDCECSSLGDGCRINLVSYNHHPI